MDIVVGYIYGKNNHTVDVTLINNPKNIANFIARCPQNSRVKVTTIFDEPIVSSLGFFLDRVCNMEYREELLKYLLPIQMEGVKPDDVEFDYDDLDEEDFEMNKEDFIKFVEEKYNYKLVG